MKTISENLKNHLASETTSLAKFILITLSEDEKIGLTTLDKEFEFENVIYKPAISADNFSNKTSFSTNDKEKYFSAFDSDLINDDFIKSGKIDNAEIEIFLLNYNFPADGKLVLKKGYISKIIYDEEKYFFEISGYSKYLTKKITNNYSPNCRARLGDSKCQVDMNSFTFTGSITSLINKFSFIDSSRAEATGYFNHGILEFLTGDNKNILKEVSEFSSGKIILTTSLPYEIQLGDEYRITAGCDKSFSTCISKFNNALNFRGEPHVPGTEKILKSVN